MVFLRFESSSGSGSIGSGPAQRPGFADLRWRGVMDRLAAVDGVLLAAVKFGWRAIDRARRHLEQARLRRLAMRELRGLNDHLLTDIGLSRPMLYPTVQRLAEQSLSGRKPEAAADGKGSSAERPGETAMVEGNGRAERRVSQVRAVATIGSAAVRAPVRRSRCGRPRGLRTDLSLPTSKMPSTCCCPAA